MQFVKCDSAGLAFLDVFTPAYHRSQTSLWIRHKGGRDDSCEGAIINHWAPFFKDLTLGNVSYWQLLTFFIHKAPPKTTPQWELIGPVILRPTNQLSATQN